VEKHVVVVSFCYMMYAIQKEECVKLVMFCCWVVVSSGPAGQVKKSDRPRTSENSQYL